MSRTLEVEAPRAPPSANMRCPRISVERGVPGQIPLHASPAKPAMTTLQLPGNRRGRQVCHVANCLVTPDKSQPPRLIRQIDAMVKPVQCVPSAGLREMRLGYVHGYITQVVPKVEMHHGGGGAWLHCVVLLANF